MGRCLLPLHLNRVFDCICKKKDLIIEKLEDTISKFSFVSAQAALKEVFSVDNINFRIALKALKALQSKLPN